MVSLPYGVAYHMLEMVCIVGEAQLMIGHTVTSGRGDEGRDAAGLARWVAVGMRACGLRLPHARLTESSESSMFFPRFTAVQQALPKALAGKVS